MSSAKNALERDTKVSVFFLFLRKLLAQVLQKFFFPFFNKMLL